MRHGRPFNGYVGPEIMLHLSHIPSLSYNCNYYFNDCSVRVTVLLGYFDQACRTNSRSATLELPLDELLLIYTVNIISIAINSSIQMVYCYTVADKKKFPFRLRFVLFSVY